MTEAQPWHSLIEAAAMTGLEREALRSRARRGLIPNRKNNRGELLVQIPAELMTGHNRSMTEAPTAAVTGDAAGQGAAIADLTAALTEALAMVERIQAEADQAKAALAQREIALARVEELAKAAAELAATKVGAAEEKLAELRQVLERELARADRLEAELQVELRRPWWRRLIG